MGRGPHAGGKKGGGPIGTLLQQHLLGVEIRKPPPERSAVASLDRFGSGSR